MSICQILAFLVIIFGIAWKYGVQLVEAVPVGSAVLVLTLYVLSFFGALSYSDGMAVLALAVTALYVVRIGKEKRKELAGFVRRELFRADTVTALVMTVVVTVCVSAKVVSWWDDYNFWATDVKALFYLDGFAGKYGNVAAEFGDYPPGTQMMKWWFLHFSPGEFREGLMFAGYYFMNLAFLFPMLRFLRNPENKDLKNKKRNVFAMAAGAVVLWLFPTVAEVFWCDGCCADFTMALVYGNFLVSVVDRNRGGRFFYYARQALFLMLLVLMKNTGFIWAAFGLLFDYGFHWLTHRMEGTDRAGKRADRRSLFPVTLLPVLTEGSWLGFCLVNRRIAKLTGAAVRMATGGMNLPYYQEGMVKAFVEAFTGWPLHRWKTVAVDVTPLGMYLLLLLFVFLLYRCGALERGTAVYTGVFLAVTGIVFYAVNLLGHLTIFAVETQYLEPFGMVSSIERYGAPFVIGGLYLLAFYAGNRRHSKAGILFCMLFVLLTADYGSAYRALYGYRSRTEDALAERERIVDGAAEGFLAALDTGWEGSGQRVLYLRDSSDVSWVRNTYIGFEAAPAPVMCGNIDASAIGQQDIVRAVREAHAGFLYVDSSAEAGETVFNALAGEAFCYDCLYRAEDTGEGLRLIRVGE